MKKNLQRYNVFVHNIREHRCVHKLIFIILTTSLKLCNYWEPINHSVIYSLYIYIYGLNSVFITRFTQNCTGVYLLLFIFCVVYMEKVSRLCCNTSSNRKQISDGRKEDAPNNGRQSSLINIIPNITPITALDSIIPWRSQHWTLHNRKRTHTANVR